MEINRKSWHYRFLNNYNSNITWWMENFPNEYCNLCYYSRSLLVALLLAAVAITIVVGAGGVMAYILGSTIYWVGLCIYHMEFVPEVGRSEGGVILILLFLTTGIITKVITYYLNNPHRLQPMGDVIGSLTGKFCVKITLKD